MSGRAERLPTSRRRVGAAALAALGALTLMIAGVDALRHPEPVRPQPTAESDDPREPISCPPRQQDPVPTVSSDDLHACPGLYDGVRVRYEGEVVGALLRRDEGTWAQLNDDAYAGRLGPLPAHRLLRGGNVGVGVHLPDALAERVRFVGGPAERGDVLQVTGTFHRTDPASGEVAVIRAREGTITSTGSPIEQAVLADRRLVGGLVALATALLLIGEPILRRRQQR